MKFTKKMKYNLKRVIPVVGLSVATLFNACDKDDKEDVLPTYMHDVEMKFQQGEKDPLNMDTIRKHDADTTVRYIYFVAMGNWSNCQAHNIQHFRHVFLAPRMKLSNKIRGRGDLNFIPGAASQVPEDSLWIVQTGWTINKYRQSKQK